MLYSVNGFQKLKGLQRVGEDVVHSLEAAGMDEAGRGPLAGGLSAAAVILGAHFPKKYLMQLKDSKQLMPKKRDYLAQVIQEHSTTCAIGWCEAAEVDQLNPLQASFEAMHRALRALLVVPKALLIDGNLWSDRFGLPGIPITQGDKYVPQISAASILAKVYRDRMMSCLHVLAPRYEFIRHKGYGTSAHLDALKRFGITPWHRLTYAPVRSVARRQVFLSHPSWSMHTAFTTESAEWVSLSLHA